MPFNTLGLSVATVGIAALASAIAAPASAQTHYPHKHYTHSHYAHSRYHHYAHHSEGRQIIVHSQAPVVVAPTYAFGPVGAVGSVVNGTGQAVGAVFYGAGGIVGGVVGGVLGGVSALFGGPGYTYTASNGYGGPFAAPFNAAGEVAGSALPCGRRRFRRDARRRLLSRFRQGRAPAYGCYESSAPPPWMDGAYDGFPRLRFSPIATSTAQLL